MLKAEVLKAKKKWFQKEPLRRTSSSVLSELRVRDKLFVLGAHVEPLRLEGQGEPFCPENHISNLSFLRLLLAEDCLSALNCQNDSQNKQNSCKNCLNSSAEQIA